MLLDIVVHIISDIYVYLPTAWNSVIAQIIVHCFSSQKARFDGSRAACMRFEVDKVALGWFFLECLHFLPSFIL
jgi:hypothetical protein